MLLVVGIVRASRFGYGNRGEIVRFDDLTRLRMKRSKQRDLLAFLHGDLEVLIAEETLRIVDF